MQPLDGYTFRGDEIVANNAERVQGEGNSAMSSLVEIAEHRGKRRRRVQCRAGIGSMGGAGMRRQLNRCVSRERCVGGADGSLTAILSCERV